MKPLQIRLAPIALSAIAALACHTAGLESTTPVAAKTNGEQWWNGNCERVDNDIRKMEGKIVVAFTGDSITARWRDDESWQ